MFRVGGMVSADHGMYRWMAVAGRAPGAPWLERAEWASSQNPLGGDGYSPPQDLVDDIALGRSRDL